MNLVQPIANNRSGQAKRASGVYANEPSPPSPLVQPGITGVEYGNPLPGERPGQQLEFTCYSEGEAGFMGRSQALRAHIMKPLLKRLTQYGVSPNQLTLLSLVVGLVFCPLFALGFKLVAFLMLFLHVLLDGVDGPLARFQGTASSQGSIADTMVDQLVITFTTIALIASGYIGTWPGGLYIFFYGIVVVFAMIRSALSIPYTWLVRPRFIIYLWIPAEVYLWPGSLNAVLWIFTILLAAKMLTGFIQIRRAIPLAGCAENILKCMPQATQQTG